MAKDPLQTLAELYGVDTMYTDVWGNLRHTSEESLLRTLQLLGAPMARSADAADAVRKRRQDDARQWLAPVLVAWGGQWNRFEVQLPETLLGERYHVCIDLEGGGSVEWQGSVNELPVCSRCDIEGNWYTCKSVPAGYELPYGYHRLAFTVGDRQAESLLIAAPTRAFSGSDDKGVGSLYFRAGKSDGSLSAGDAAVKTPDPFSEERLWGVFLPLYALRRKSSVGAGNLSDLEALMEWTAARGGNLVATLPLLATLWELTDDPSPYNPASRLFWNEFYLDPSRIPGIEACPEAREQLHAMETAVASHSAGRPRLIDYPAQMAGKRRALELLAAKCFEPSSPQRAALAQYCREHPELEPFARFRAVGEREGQAWPQWPEPLRSGALSDADYDEDVFHYHLFTQWQVEQQLEASTQHARRLNLLWYLDFPLGVNGAGYDVWREPDLFVRGASGGAPPDSFFTKGQDWGFPPLHPDRLRRQGYDYFICALRNHLRHARILRLDHVMGLYRLYWVPHGFSAADGAYVRYPMDEFCAILTLESHRFGARIVGENLGTVPHAVDEAMLRHGLDDMYVLQYETNPEKGPTLRRTPPTAVASINTHDMPQFAAYWKGLDIDDRLGLGLFTPAEAAAEHARRGTLRAQLVAFLQAERLLDADCADTPDVLTILEACQAYLAKSPAKIVQVNLEDLWGETEPQNRPGTYREYPNWRRQAQHPLEAFGEIPAVIQVLATVDRLRKQSATEASKPES